MELFIRTAWLSVIFAAVSGEECVDSNCFTANSTHAWNGVTINYGCQHTGSRLYRCSLSIMGQSDINNDKTHCVALGNIPGIHQFCKSHILGLGAPSAPPFIPDVNNNNINSNDKNDIRENNKDDKASEHPDDKPIKYETEYVTCIEVEVLVGVSIGSFVLGSFVTWALITILAQCKNIKKELRDAHRSNSIRAIGQPLVNCEMTSTSAHQRLLSIGSAESCPSMNPIGQHSGQSRRYSGETGHEESGRPFQMRQPLPAPPAPVAKLQPYYVQPIDSLYACASDKDYQSIQGGSEHYAPIHEDSTVHGATRTSCDQKTFYARPIDSLYTCTSDKDYQSLQGGSEHYAPVNEGSDYTSLKSNRNTVLSEADVTGKSNEEIGERNDYCSLESARNVPDAGAVYYPASDGSNRDYTDLIGDGDSESCCSVNHRNVTTTFDKQAVNKRANTPITDKRKPNGQTGNVDAVIFRVNGCVGKGGVKRSESSSKPVLGSSDNAPKETGFGLREHASRSETSDASLKEKRFGTNEKADGNETIQQSASAGLNQSGLGKETCISTFAGSGTGTRHGGGLVTKPSYAGTDHHDYESCNGSIHEYFILEDATSAV